MSATSYGPTHLDWFYLSSFCNMLQSNWVFVLDADWTQVCSMHDHSGAQAERATANLRKLFLWQ